MKNQLGRKISFGSGTQCTSAVICILSAPWTANKRAALPTLSKVLKTSLHLERRALTNDV